MFFGGIKPSEKILAKVKIKREPFIACSTDKGKCRGQLPRMVDGEIKIMFVYLDMPEQYTIEEYSKAIQERAVYDEGITITKCTAIIGDNTFCWFE